MPQAQGPVQLRAARGVVIDLRPPHSGRVQRGWRSTAAMALKIDIKPEPKRWSVRIEDRTVALCADLRQAARLAAALQALAPSGLTRRPGLG
jgi:hypothetical protein